MNNHYSQFECSKLKNKMMIVICTFGGGFDSWKKRGADSIIVPLAGSRSEKLYVPSVLLNPYQKIQTMQVTLVKMVNEATENIPNWGS